jgi:hypothetical protein
MYIRKSDFFGSILKCVIIFGQSIIIRKKLIFLRLEIVGENLRTFKNNVTSQIDFNPEQFTYWNF